MLSEDGLFWSQKEVIKHLNLSFYTLSKLREKHSIKTYSRIYDDKSVYYNVLELKEVMQTFFQREESEK